MTNPNEIIAAVAENRMNWVKAKKILRTLPDFATNLHRLGEAVAQADAARLAADGYHND